MNEELSPMSSLKKEGEKLSRSFGLLKPDCLKRGIQKDVFRIIRSSGLKIVKAKKAQIDEQNIALIWPTCRKEDFYEDMVRFSMSGICIVFIVEGENAIERLNELVGYHDPIQAKRGSIRALFGSSKMENIIHSSSCEDTFEKEALLFFDPCG